MPPEVSEQIFNAVRYLFVSGIVCCAYHLASGASADKTRRKAVGKCLLYCFGIAAFASLSMGSPSCSDDGDPIRGGCERYEDDGFQPSPEQHGGRFLFVFVLLFTPALLGAVNSSKGRFWSGAKDEEDPEEIEIRNLRLKLRYGNLTARQRDKNILRYANLIEARRVTGKPVNVGDVAAFIAKEAGLSIDIVCRALNPPSVGSDDPPG